MSKVLAIGNALVDILIRLKDEQILKDFKLDKGSMQLADMSLVKDIQYATAMLDTYQASGGSAANTIHGLAKLGIQAGFIGKVGKDGLGAFFRNDMTENDIDAKLKYSSSETGRAMTMVTPDSERTFATFLGAAAEMTADDVTPDVFEGYEYFYVEGYLVFNHDLLKNALATAKSKGLKICLDLASYNVVEANLDFLNEIIENYVDIIFANEEEAKALTGLNPGEALHKIAENVDYVIVKLGKEGSLIKHQGQTFRVEGLLADAIDTTGAGDLYAAGFLYGLINGKNLNTCGQIGSITAGNVVEVIGAKMDEKRWSDIKNKISELN